MNDGSPLILAGTVCGLFVLGLALVHALMTRHTLRAIAVTGAGTLWAGLYAATLLVTSARSHEVILPAGDTKWFCGFYLDCHLGVAAVRLVTAPQLGTVRASGTFHVLTLRVRSSARRATLQPHDLRIVLVDAHGRHFVRSTAAEAMLAGPNAGLLERPLGPGDSYTVDVVFDLPNDAREPRLLVTEGPAMERVVERILVGDEDSFLHQPTLLLLPGQGPQERSEKVKGD